MQYELDCFHISFEGFYLELVMTCQVYCSTAMKFGRDCDTTEVVQFC